MAPAEGAEVFGSDFGDVEIEVVGVSGCGVGNEAEVEAEEKVAEREAEQSESEDFSDEVLGFFGGEEVGENSFDDAASCGERNFALVSDEENSSAEQGSCEGWMENSRDDDEVENCHPRDEAEPEAQERGFPVRNFAEKSASQSAASCCGPDEKEGRESEQDCGVDEEENEGVRAEEGLFDVGVEDGEEPDPDDEGSEEIFEFVFSGISFSSQECDGDGGRENEGDEDSPVLGIGEHREVVGVVDHEGPEYFEHHD
jgi:hypothetical protein